MNNLKNSLILLVCVLYFVNFALDNYVIATLISIALLILFASSLRQVSFIPMVVGSILLMIGFYIEVIINGKSFIRSLLGLQNNLPLLLLILTVPLLAIPLKSGQLINQLNGIVAKQSTPIRSFTSLTFFVAIITPILNLGAIKVVHEIIKDNNLHKPLMAKSYFIGFSSAALWSPYFGSVALVLFYLNVDFSKYILIGITFAIFQIAIGSALFYFQVGRHQELEGTSTSVSKPMATNKTMILKILSTIAFFIVIIILLEKITLLPMMMIVSIVSIVTPFLWGMFSNRWSYVKKSLAAYSSQLGGAVNTEIVLFLSAGLFGKALASSSASELIKGASEYLVSASFHLFVVCIILIVMVLSFIGIHQIVTVPLIAMQLDPTAIGVSPVVLAFVLILAWVVSQITSPLNAISIIISNSVQKRSVVTGIVWNGAYAITMFISGIVFISLLNQLGL
ncbi:hypothetical protein [Sporosarcina luteola]|uniref:hypothetical protein n=1 Tax=Sporosarcina luteola TaxID=582850 RepID=UPI00203E17CF|nr:hypothetical protein [Sporosarcina luteola]MCM3709138.1 hypothetical protein [Sporosarcina luteola]